MQNDLLLKTLQDGRQARPPLWLMRQAGRYLPEYRLLREKFGDFMSFCKHPEAAAEATLQPLERFQLDAVIVFSDILTILDAWHLGLRFEAGEGPRIETPIRTHNDLRRLPKDNAAILETLSYVFEAIRQARSAVRQRVPLIGFAGSPWTVACYAVEQGRSKHFEHIKTLRYQHPDVLIALLERLAAITTDYLVEQARAGADVLMIFDTWGGALSHEDFWPFSGRWMEDIARGLRQRLVEAPLILFTRDGGRSLERMSEIEEVQAIGLDEGVDLKTATTRVQDRVVLQGNLDAAALFAPPFELRRLVQRQLQSYAGHRGHIYNLGHGVLPNTPLEAVSTLVETVKQFRYGT